MSITTIWSSLKHYQTCHLVGSEDRNIRTFILFFSVCLYFCISILHNLSAHSWFPWKHTWFLTFWAWQITCALMSWQRVNCGNWFCFQKSLNESKDFKKNFPFHVYLGELFKRYLSAFITEGHGWKRHVWFTFCVAMCSRTWTNGLFLATFCMTTIPLSVFLS